MTPSTKKAPLRTEAEAREAAIGAEILRRLRGSIPVEWVEADVRVKLGHEGAGSGGDGQVALSLAKRRGKDSKELVFGFRERELLAMATRRASSTGLPVSRERSELWDHLPKEIGDLAIGIFTDAAVHRLSRVLRGEEA